MEVMKKDVAFPYRFFLVTYLWSWLIWSPLVLLSLKIIPASEKLLTAIKLPVLVFGVFGPLAGAIFSIKKEKGWLSVKEYLRSFLDFRLGWKAYILPVLIFGGSTFIAWFTPELFGEKRLPMLLPSIWIFIPYLPFIMLFGGGQEEFGWRGYALPILENRFGIWLANLVMGLIWSVWHLPLFFIQGTSQFYMNFGGFIILMTGYSYILSWLRNISGNKTFTGVYVHGLFNAFIPFMPTIIMQPELAQPRFWIWAGSTLLTGIIITVFRDRKAFQTQCR